MKAINALLVLATLCSTAHAEVDDVDVLLYQLGNEIDAARTNGLDSAPCTETLGKLRALNVPASRTIETLGRSPYLGAGHHPLPAARKACDALEYDGKRKLTESAILHAIEFGAVDGCVKFWPDALAAGVRPTDRIETTVTVDRKQVKISGTLAELEAKYCETARQQNDAKTAAREAPYRKVLRNDKLDLWLNARHGITLPGGDKAEVPAKLAAARIWYSDRYGEDCTDGRSKYIVTRYEFDKNQKVAKQSTKEYCGGPEYK
jgi:hypothetical protein